MSSHPARLRFVWLLVAALLMRAAVPAFAMPGMIEPDSARSASATHCHEADDTPPPALPQHGDSSCRIACDLGAAPALMPFLPVTAESAPAVQVARVPVLALAEAPPPDHPPPI
jgi:hypothetical protein